MEGDGMSNPLPFRFSTRTNVGVHLSAEKRELEYLRAQPIPDQNAIEISERAVQRLEDEYDSLPEE
jgi:hypothetical protein